MLRLIQYTYVFLPMLVVVLALSSFFLRWLKDKRASSVFRWSARGVLVLFLLNFLVLWHNWDKLQKFEIKGMMTRADVRREIGSPTRVIDPAIPYGTVWHYTITVSPFKYRRSVEFDGDQAVSSPEWYPGDCIGHFDW